MPGTNWINFSFTQNICWIPKWAPTHVFSSRYVICDAKFWQPRNMAFQRLKNIIHYLLHNISTGPLSKKAEVCQHIFASVSKFTKLIMIDEFFSMFFFYLHSMAYVGQLFFHFFLNNFFPYFRLDSCTKIHFKSIVVAKPQ